MKYIPKARTAILTETPSSAVDVKDDVGSLSPSFDVDTLLDSATSILVREIRNLSIASSRGKLEAADARDLVSYIKLLSDIRNEQATSAAAMTDAELLKKANG